MPASGSIEQAQRRELLLQLARASIDHGVLFQQPRPLDTVTETWLLAPSATFVTLYRRNGQQQLTLRGCIGSLVPRRALAHDVNENAYAAAFRDPRFPPLRRAELLDLQVEVAVLSTVTALPPVVDESALLALLRPEIDGVIIEQDGRRATFLPKVWPHFQDGADFLQSLRQKAGLPADFDPSARYSVYQVQVYAEWE